MILWTLAFILLACLGVVGYYQGAVRAAFSLVGLLLASMLGVPLGKLIKPILPAFSLTHPVVIAFVAPAVMYLVVLVLFKVGGFAVHKKLDTHLKYKASDTQRSLFERMSARVGIGLGLINAVIYLFVIATVAYTLGYFTTQVATPGNDGFVLRLFNNFNEDMRRTGLARAAAHFSPATEAYYDATDLLADVFRNPLLQGRLSSYPPFLTLSERPEFGNLGGMEFQRFWQGQRTIGDVWKNENLKPLIKEVEPYTNTLATLGGDLKDLIAYFETGKSPKYDEDKILGRWKFDYRQSYNQTKRAKPNMSLNEMTRARKFLAGLDKTTFMATVDHKAVLKVALPSGTTTVNGTWKNNGGGRFGLRMSESGRSVEAEARADIDRLNFNWLGFSFVFERVEK
jgi:uncharacterized membrane protein required for colicin V production